MTLLLTHGRLFLSLAGWRLYALVVLTLIMGLVDIIGLSMIVPILEIGINAEGGKSSISHAVSSVLLAVGLTPTLKLLLALVVLIFLLKAVIVFAADQTIARIQTTVQEALRMQLTERVFAANLPYLLRTRVGETANVFVTEIQQTVGNLKALSMLACAVILFLVYFSASLWANWQMGLSMIGLATVLLWAFRGINRMTRKLSFKIADNNERIQNQILQGLNNVKYLKATESKSPVISHLRTSLNQRRKDLISIHVLRAFVAASIEPIAVCVAAIFILLSITGQERTLGAAVLPLLFLYRTVSRVGEIQKSWQSFLRTAGSVASFTKTWNALADQAESTSGLPCPELRKSIQLRDVTFAWGTSDKPLLDRVSIDIPRNSVVGLTGPTGAGKTTLVDLVCAVLPSRTGSVTWDNSNYCEFDPRSIRSRIGYVTQDPVIFNDTIANNITLWGSCDLSFDERASRMRTAAAAAQCLEFIESTEHQFDTEIGERGFRLSGGQRQRIAIARELYRQPEILIFDEGTSSLDVNTEAALQETLDALGTSSTLIVIAHRLSTLKHCSHIYVLEQGRIIESGSWDELMAVKGGWFAKMTQLQGTA